jgi:hypothetical protein
MAIAASLTKPMNLASSLSYRVAAAQEGEQHQVDAFLRRLHGDIQLRRHTDDPAADGAMNLLPATTNEAVRNFRSRQFERQNAKNFLDQRQPELAVRKSPDRHISPRASAGPAEVELTILRKEKERICNPGENEAQNASVPHPDKSYLIDPSRAEVPGALCRGDDCVRAPSSFAIVFLN